MKESFNDRITAKEKQGYIVVASVKGAFGSKEYDKVRKSVNKKYKKDDTIVVTDDNHQWEHDHEHVFMARKKGWSGPVANNKKSTKKKGSSKPLTASQTKEKLSTVKRSSKAIEMDSRKVAKTVYPKNPTKDQLDRYMRYPNRYDIEGVDAPLGSATTKNADHTKYAKPKKKKVTGRSKMEYSQSWYDKLPWEDDPETAYRLAAEAHSLEGKESTEDMLAWLKDIRYDEVAENNRWMYDSRDIVKSYESSMWEREKMLAYNKKGCKRNRITALFNRKRNKKKAR